jgi:glycosyltransferase involved in cell wall biosynthesis
VRHTRLAWELIVIDNGSTDDTAAYLFGVQDAARVPVTIISNTHNQGFPAAINQGLQLAVGEYLVLVNNDAVVTDGWLDQLIALSRATTNGPEGSKIGLVGPMTNYAPPPQLVEHVPYRDLKEMEVFARRWRDEHRGQWFTAAKVSGFCLLMTRDVHESIGGLDERFGLGFFDDDDLALRARQAGFELAVAHDLFVHHFGSRTFVGNAIDAERLLEENARRFEAKWRQHVPEGRRMALRPWLGDEGPRMTQVSPVENSQVRTLGEPALPSPSSHLRESAQSADQSLHSFSRTVKVTLTLIVRNEQENLPRCLQSVSGLFDEIVVVDTGSIDATRDIAAEFGARVFDFPWIDDFAAARNSALAHATGDYIFWLDADDVVDPAERVNLQALLEGLNGQTAYVVRCACDPSSDGSGGETVVDHIRLFPLRDDVRWAYRVHEQILPALRRVRIPVRWSDLTVRHTGYTDPALRARKLDRDTRILLEEIKERPDDPFVLFNLGAIALERQEWPQGLDYLRRSLARSSPSDSITRKLFALIARAHQMMGNSAAALRVCDEGLSLDPEDAELWFRKGIVHRSRGESGQAETCWRKILGLKRPEQFCSVERGIYGHLTRRNLAVLATERGDRGEAARLWAEVLAECPGDREALAKLKQLDPDRGSSPAPSAD